MPQNEGSFRQLKEISKVAHDVTIYLLAAAAVATKSLTLMLRK